MSTQTETGDVTGTRDKDYDIIWFTEQCLSNALRLETYIQDAERDDDAELAEFFRKAQAEGARRAAEEHVARCSDCWAVVSLLHELAMGGPPSDAERVEALFACGDICVGRQVVTGPITGRDRVYIRNAIVSDEVAQSPQPAFRVQRRIEIRQHALAAHAEDPAAHHARYTDEEALRGVFARGGRATTQALRMR